jgi:hypothetical protein
MTRSVAVEPRERTEGRKKFFHAMFTTALEGGIGYWSIAEEYHWILPAPEGQPPTYAEDLDNFHARISSTESDWGVEAAYQPNTMNGEIHPNFTPGSHMLRIVPDEILTIDIDVIERGWKLFMDRVLIAARAEDPSMECSRHYFRQAIIAYLTDGEEGDYDADIADLVVQYGLFGEIVYA